MNVIESLYEEKLKLPNWKKAQEHAQAIIVGRTQESSQLIQQNDECCQCCGNSIQKIPISLCQNTKELEFIGIGFPLYFVFFKYCILLMILETICTSMFDISNAMDSNYDFCFKNVPREVHNLDEEIFCTSLFIYLASIDEHLSNQTAVTRIVFFLLTILYFIYMRDSLRKLNRYYDERNTTFSDYTFMLKELPLKDKIKEDINILFSSYQIVSITLVGTFDHIYSLEQRLEVLNQQKKKMLKIIERKDKNSKEVNQLLNEFQDLQKKVEEHEMMLLETFTNEQSLYLKDEIIPQKVIVSVETDEEKEEIIQKMKSGEGLNIPGGWSLEQFKKIHVAQSPQPREIIWKSLNITSKQKLKNIIIGWTVTFSFLALITVIFYFVLIQLMKSIEKQEQSNITLAKFYFYITLVIIIIVNKFLLAPLLHRICHYQKYFTKTKEQYGFTVKYLLSMFFTTAMMTVLIEGITKKNFYSHQFGVIDSESIMIIYASLLTPLIWLLNPWNLIIKIKQYYNRTNKHLTQIEANGIMEPMEYQMGKRYAEVVKLVWLVFLYRSLIPIGPALATIGLAVYYWVDKYNLLRRSSVKEAVSGFLTLRVMTLLEFSIVLKCGGELFFDLQIRYEYSKVSVVCLIVGLIYMILPKNRLLEYIHNQKFNSEEKKLSQCLKDLGSSYEDLHPVMGKKTKILINSLASKFSKTDVMQPQNIYSLNESIFFSSEIVENAEKSVSTKNRQARQKVLDRSHCDAKSVLLNKKYKTFL